MIVKVRYDFLPDVGAYVLVHPKMGRVSAFDAYLTHYIETENPSQNSIDAKTQDLKNFFEYLYTYPEVAFDAENEPKRGLSKSVLHDVITQYPRYLSLGQDAGDIAGRIALETGCSPKNPKSVGRMLSSVNTFLKSSANFHAEMKKAEGSGLVNLDVDQETLFSDLLKKRKLSSIESKALIANSMMSGVIAGGAKYITSNLFKVGKNNRQAGEDVPKAFPLNDAYSLVSSAKNLRDICFWSLLFGTGIRLHEALQVMLEDIDARNREVKIIAPNSRPAAYSVLSNKTRQKISYKGRSSSETYFIEPYKTIFFNTLAEYLQKERVATLCNHNFLFVTRDGSRSPYLAASNKVYNKSFKAAQKRIGYSEKQCFTVHSTRHFYGVFCRNYFPLGDGNFGLPLETVRDMMAHASELSTDIYAVVDKEIRKRVIQSANKVLLENKFNVDLAKKKAITCRIKQ